MQLFFAYQGLTTWRKELKGKSEYQLAKEVLKSVYRVREAFISVRNPGIYQYEFPKEMLDGHGYLKQVNVYEGTAYVYEKRWEMMRKAFQELEEHHLDAQVEWGGECQDVILKLRSCKVDLQIAIMQMLERMKNTQEFSKTNVDELAKEQSIIYYRPGSKDDTFSFQIDEAINEFEKWLRPHIKR